MFVNGAIGSIAGFAIQISIYPFDYFRIMLSNEVKAHPGYGLVKCIKEAILHRGFRGIFNGVMINLVYMTGARGIYFAVYDSYKFSLTQEVFKILLSYVSLVTALFICYPIDSIRKRVIMSKNRHKNVRSLFKVLWNEGKLM